MRYVAAGLFGAQMAVLAHGVFDAVLWGTKPAFIGWWLLGLMVVIHPKE